jgi:ribonuclease HI
MSEIRAVIYVDGGAEPPRGPGGSGMYGYTWSETVEGPNDDDYHPTDQGYYTVKNVPKDAKWVQPLETFEGVVSYPMAVTNNIAELGAAILAFETIRNRGWKHTWLRPDSEYVRIGYQDNLPKWQRNGWQLANGDPVKNQAQWEALAQLGAELRRADLDLNWRWVKGHSEDPGNQRADMLATQGKGYATLARAMRTVNFAAAEPVVRGEAVKVPTANRLLNMPRWYFTNTAPATETMEDGRFVYYGGSHGKDDELFAKPMADSTFCVTVLKEADPVMESIRAEQFKLNPDNFCEMVIGHLDNILSPRVYNSLYVNGTKWTDPCPGTNDLMYGGEQLLTRELTKPRLALNAVDTLLFAEELLKGFLNGTLDAKYKRQSITETLYDVTEKKEKKVFKLRKDISTASKTVDVVLPYDSKGKPKELKTRIVLGQDLPRRNTLSHLASEQPEVTVLSWSKDPLTLCFATVVVCGEDASIWMGQPANYRVIPKE